VPSPPQWLQSLLVFAV